MKVPVAVLALAILIISAPACAPAADEEPAGDEAAAAADMPSAEAGIAEADAAFAAAWDAGDGAAMAALYTDDAIVLQGFIESLVGSQVALETIEVRSGNGVAIEVGSWAITGADGEHVDHGKYIVAWKYVDGVWRLHRDIFNSSMEQ
jgi:ketosteroid isomerase-like protein